MGGGGVVAEFFRDLRSRPDSVGGGGVVAEFFFLVTPGQNQPSYLTSARFLEISDSKNVTTSIRCRKKTFTKSLGGPWPPCPPPWLRHCSVGSASLWICLPMCHWPYTVFTQLRFITTHIIYVLLYVYNVFSKKVGFVKGGVLENPLNPPGYGPVYFDTECLSRSCG